METTQISRFLLELGRLSTQAGVLVVVVLAAQWAFRKRLAPRWCCALWLLVALRLAMPFSFSSVTSIFNLLPGLPRAQAETPLPQSAPEISSVVTPQMPIALRGDPAPTVPAPTPIVIPQSAPRWPVWMLVTWLAGVCVLAAQVVVSSIRFWSRSKNWRAADAAAIQELEKCCERLGVRRRPALWESAEVASPGLCGLWRPCLVLPEGFTARFSGVELQFVFLHELAHMKRRDLPMNWVVTALQIVHWFNPLVWLGFSRWRADREMACDAMALEAAGEDRHQEYGRTILRLLEHFAHSTSTPGVVGILEDKRQMRRRMTMIAEYMPGRGWPVLAAVLVGGLAVVGLTDARSQSASAGLLSVTSSRSEGGYDGHINIENVIPTGAGVTVVGMAASSNFTGWKAEAQVPSDALSNWTAATSNFDAWYARGGVSTVSARTADELIGAWVLVGTPDKIGKIPTSGGRMKFYTGKDFCMTQADPKTGVVLYHHGGTYRVNGDEYVESITYANPTTMSFIGGTNGHFNIKIDGDTMTLIGIGNRWEEVWKRADKPASGESQTRKNLIGTWVLVEEHGQASPPSLGSGFKFITGSDWCDTQADTKTGIVVVHHGGTWSLKGDRYVESVKYANPGTLPLVGHDFTFEMKLEGDTLRLKGIENPWDEVWQRVK